VDLFLHGACSAAGARVIGRARGQIKAAPARRRPIGLRPAAIGIFWHLLGIIWLSAFPWPRHVEIAYRIGFVPHNFAPTAADTIFRVWCRRREARYRNDLEQIRH
jgi:hypothetical protein